MQRITTPTDPIVSGGRRRRALVAAALAALTALALAGCDSDEEPVEDTSTEMDTTEVDTAPMIEPCPATGARLQAQPVILELLDVEVGDTATATINLNSAGDGQLCFPTSGAITVDPEVEGLTFGPLMSGGEAVEALDPGQQGSIEVTWAPSLAATGTALVSLAPDNASPAEVQLRYDAGGGTMPGDPIGDLQVFATLGYVFDSVTWNQDVAYRDSQPDGLMTSPAFTGTLDGSPVPSNDAVNVRAYALHTTGGQVLVEQVGFTGEPWSDTMTGVRVQVAFFQDTLTAGTVSLAPDDPATEGHALLTLLGDELGERCVLAVGVGALSITEATGTDAEGGSLSLRPSDPVGLYRPSEVPSGDVTAVLDDLGYTVCTGIEP